MRYLLDGFRRRRTAPAVEDDLPVDALRQPIDLLVFTESETFTLAEVRAPIGRISDWLNSAEEIRGHKIPDPSPAGDTWISLDRSGCLIVVPPVAATDPKLRLHRSRQRVSMRLGPIAVSGAAHTPAGTEATGFLRRHARAFIPLTASAHRPTPASPRTWPSFTWHWPSRYPGPRHHADAEPGFRLASRAGMEPKVGFEPTTDGLRNRCSTPELLRRAEARFYQPMPPIAMTGPSCAIRVHPPTFSPSRCAARRTGGWRRRPAPGCSRARRPDRPRR